MGNAASTTILVASLALVVAGAALATSGCSGDEGKPGPGPAPGTTSGDAADAGGGEGGSNGGKLKAAEQGCHAPEDCETNNCFAGGNQSFCTIPCTSANAPTTCTTPYTGTCNKGGFCKRD